MKNLLLTAMAIGLVILAWHPGNGVRAATGRGPLRAIVVDAIDSLEIEQAPMQIADASIEGEVLVLDVTYKGGCKVHDFKLFVADGAPRESSAAVLAHQSYGDSCENVVTESLRFDLSALDGAFSVASTDRSRIDLTPR